MLCLRQVVGGENPGSLRLRDPIDYRTEFDDLIHQFQWIRRTGEYHIVEDPELSRNLKSDVLRDLSPRRAKKKIKKSVLRLNG